MKFTYSSIFLALLLVGAPFLFAKDSPEYTQFGHQINVAAGQKTGDLTCFACSIHIRGEVAGEVTAFGGNVVLEEGGSVSGDVTTFGGVVRVGSGSKIAGDLTALGGKISRDPNAQIAGDVTALVGPVWLVLIFGLPVFLLAGIVALIIWLVQKRQPPPQTYAKAA